MTSMSIPELVSKRARVETANEGFGSNFYLNNSFIDRLSLECELSGHKGCVNCLEWSKDGTLLASGSDDLTVKLWNPMRRKEMTSLNSGHRSNIFSVKFLEESNNQLVASAAADGQVRVHNIEAGETINVFNCHRYRVKRLCTSKLSPFLVWSAGEDGTVRVIDLRQSHSCSAGHCNNTCINLNGENISNGSQLSEAKCIAISPTKPYIAVGSSDQFVRLFDIRQLRLCNEDFVECFGAMSLREPAAVYCVPGHLAHPESGVKKGRSRMGFSSFKTVSSTFVTFNETGSELLVNLGSEQIYLFDMLANTQSFEYLFPQTRYHLIQKLKSSEGSFEGRNDSVKEGALLDDGAKDSHSKYPEKTMQVWSELKEKANEYFRTEFYMDAVSCYSKLLQMTSYNAQIIYANRALALMKRKWSGDVYAAVLDLKKAIEIDPTYSKAHLRLIKCLWELDWIEEAFTWSALLQQHLHSIKADQSFVKLHEELKDIREKSAPKYGSASLSSEEFSAYDSDSASRGNINQQEMTYRKRALDFKKRFCGHCNAATDIKEANFLGKGEGQYVVAGSDDGSFFIWDKQNTNLLRVMVGDESIVNCLQPNPQFCMLATSGIDDSIKLWSPGNPNVENPHLRRNLSSVASCNQRRLHQDPIETFFSLNFASISAANRFTSSANSSDDEGNTSNEETVPDTCRTS